VDDVIAKMKPCQTCGNRLIYSVLLKQWLHVDGPTYVDQGLSSHEALPTEGD
jgi:hypothetical protein